MALINIAKVLGRVWIEEDSVDNVEIHVHEIMAMDQNSGKDKTLIAMEVVSNLDYEFWRKACELVEGAEGYQIIFNISIRQERLRPGQVSTTIELLDWRVAAVPEGFYR